MNWFASEVAPLMLIPPPSKAVLESNVELLMVSSEPLTPPLKNPPPSLPVELWWKTTL